MKKLLTVLLTIVMAVCLINSNNSQTRAEDNEQNIESQEALTLLKEQETPSNPVTDTIYWGVNSSNELHLSSTNDFSSYESGKHGEGNLVITKVSNQPWYTYRKDITKVVIDKNISPSNTAFWFDTFIALTSVEGLSHLDTSNVTTMRCMFNGCSSLSTLDLSDLDTSNVTTMWAMFYQCESLSSIDLSDFDTSNVTNMNSMFDYCSGLSSLDLSDFDTSKVTIMSSMFRGCSSLSSLDLSNFDTSKVTTMDSMFSGCTGLSSLNLSGFDTSKVTKMNKMFENCSSLSSLDLSDFNTSNVQEMAFMFKNDNLNASSLTKIVVGDNWNTTNVTNSYNMFADCNNLVGEKGTTYDSNHTDKEYARVDGGTATPGYLTAAPKPAPPTPSPEPQPKDESCEKIIGPTWHWNNDKGICEDYGVVGTSTR